ncbi:MAG: VWA domain-containing protein [Candidatus Sericytochromatia bacterium]|jgi:Mg-chelatase subunit ChlD|nr:VWA domain-containing protein [Candidatus Sericytochromatia bacterium]
MLAALRSRAEQLQQKRQADILFVFDCTASMQGEIDTLKDTIIAFAESIQRDGVRARVGLIEYRDRLINEEHTVHRFGGEVFTQDVAAFRHIVGNLRASGGGDEPESAYDALLEATRQPFHPESQHVLVLITDAPPHQKDREVQSIDTLIEAFRQAPIHQFYPVINTRDVRCQQTYLRLYESSCRGAAFDMGKGEDFKERAAHFQRTLMQLGKTISTATR